MTLAVPLATSRGSGLWARKSREIILAGLLMALTVSVAATEWPMWVFTALNHDFMIRYWPQLQTGFITTINLTAVSIVVGGILAFPLAFARLSKNRIIGGFAFGYVYFFRGTPLLAQAFLIYAGLGQFLGPYKDTLIEWNVWWIAREGYWYVLFAFALNTAAYQAEILRGAIQSIPKGQREACQSLGVSHRVGFWKVIMPQSLITALRPYGNEIILMIKGSAVATLLTVFDLMGMTKLAFSRSYNFEIFFWAAVLYLLLVETLRQVWDILEWHLTRHLRPATG
jgi:polar amino acid transport system permease protein